MLGFFRGTPRSSRSRRVLVARPAALRSLGFEALEDRRFLAADFNLLADINAIATIRGLNPTEIVTVGEVAYFDGETPTGGRELWCTDGTAAGTRLVRDITIGSAGSSPRHLTAVGSTLYFSADDGTAVGREVWKSDGTPESTVRVADVRSDGDSVVNSSRLVNLDGKLYFTGATGLIGGALWTTDGTTAGTIKVFSSLNLVQAPISYAGAVYFIAHNGQTTSLYRTDGTPGGTTTVMSAPDMAGLTATSNLMFFAADSGSFYGREIWKSDGTASGTQSAFHLASATNIAAPNDHSIIGVIGETLFLNIDDNVNGNYLWKTNGTLAGTGYVGSVLTAAGPALDPAVKPPAAVIGDTLYFVGSHGPSGYELWRTDGTAANTTLVRDIRPSINTTAEGPQKLTNIGGTLYFTADDGVHGREVWKSNGTLQGTVMVADLAPDAASSAPTALAPLGSTALFAANDGVHGAELWATPVGAAPQIVFDQPDSTAAPNLGALSPLFNGFVYFSANDGVHGTELWRTDGTPAGTTLIDLDEGPSGSSPSQFVVLDGSLYFTASAAAGYGLYKSDGTLAGTTLVKGSQSTATSPISNLTSAGGKLYFSLREGSADIEPWTSDGTPEGTFRLKDIRVGTTGSDPGQFTAFDGFVYFTANATTAPDLWKTDGTTAGTVIVRDLTNVSNLVVSGDKLFFLGNDGTHGLELWKVDASAPDGAMVKDINVNNVSQTSTNGDLTDVNGTLFFRASDGVNGHALYKSDGTTDGTVLVKDVDPGASGSSGNAPSLFSNIDGVLYFSANDGVHGRELWKSDGTPDGTVMIADISPGGASSSPTRVRLANGVPFFNAFTPQFGRELWTTDGTPTGTHLEWDSTPGPAGGAPSLATSLAAGALFGATSDLYGFEFWLRSSTAPGDFDRNGLVDGNDFLVWQRTDVTSAGLTEWRAAFAAASALAGDYDRNGRVEGGDFLLWQRTLGGAASPTGSSADGDSNGTIDAGDLTVWRNHFASTVMQATVVAAQIQSTSEAQAVASVAAVDIAFRDRDAASLLGPLAYREAAQCLPSGQLLRVHRVGVELHAAAPVHRPRAGMVVEARHQVGRPVVDETRLSDLGPLGANLARRLRLGSHDGDVPGKLRVGILEHGDDELAGVR
jgi:ELWxxDGT repeat protein